MISQEDRQEYRRLFGLAFPDHVRALARAGNKRHPGRSSRLSRLHRLRHLEQIRQNDRDRYAERRNRGDFRAALKRHYRKHKDQYDARWRARDELKKERLVGSKKEIAKIYRRAKELRQWFKVVVDHIIPLSKGGEHSVKNLQIIYQSENKKKHNRLDYIPAVVFK